MVNIGDIIFQILMLLILIGGAGIIVAFIIGLKRKSLDYTEALLIHQCF